MPGENDRYLPWPDLVWPKTWLRSQLQDFYFAPPRAMPPPDVFGALTAMEINEDAIAMGIDVADPDSTPSSQEGASVVITEIAAFGEGAMSIRE